MTIEFILETYSEGVTRRFSLPRSEWDEMMEFQKTENLLEGLWDFKDIRGAHISLDMSKLTGLRMYKRKVDNPLESNEVYENPLS